MIVPLAARQTVILGVAPRVEQPPPLVLSDPPRADDEDRSHVTQMNPALRRLFRAPVYLYLWKCGWALGHRFLLLIHIGRRTGLRHYTVLEVVEYREEGPEAVVVSAFGRNADWLRNIEATRGPEIVIGSQRFVVEHHFLGEEEAMRVIAGYERRNWLITPIVRLGFSRLLGWRYGSSTSDRRRLVDQLPLIAFHRR